MRSSRALPAAPYWFSTQPAPLLPQRAGNSSLQPARVKGHQCLLSLARSHGWHPSMAGSPCDGRRAGSQRPSPRSPSSSYRTAPRHSFHGAQQAELLQRRPPLRCSTPTAPFSHGAAANLHGRPSVADQRPCPYLQPLLAILRGACRLFDEMSSCCRRAPCLSPRDCSLDVVVEPSLLRLAPSTFLGSSIKCLTEQLVLGSPFAMPSTPVRHLAALAAIVFLCSVKIVELLYVSNSS
jgi:hypothetical protein